MKKLAKINPLKVCLVLVLLSIYFVELCKSQDADMFWIIANGKEILQNGILRTNPTSIVEISIVNQQWLYCVITALFDKFGYIGHIGFVFIQDCLLICLASYWLNSKIHDKYKSVVLSIGIMTICGYMINIRPQVITMCLLIAHMIILDKAQENKKWYLFTIPIIILEANLHGALFLYHGILVVPYLIKNKKINWYAFASAVSIIPLSLINPYGFGMIQYAINALTSPAFKYVIITELLPTSPLTTYSWNILLGLGLFIICAFMRKLNFKTIWYSTIILILSMHQVRHTSVLYLPLLVMCGQIFENLKLPEFKFLQNKDIRLVSNLLVFIATIFMCFASFVCIYYPQYDIRYKDNQMSSYTLSQKIENKDAKILSNFNNGGYLEYVGFNKVMIDQRPEIYVENDVLKDWSILTYGKDTVENKVYTFEEMDNLANKYNFDYVFAVKSNVLDRLCQEYPDKYQFIDSDDIYNLYKVIND